MSEKSYGRRFWTRTWAATHTVTHTAAHCATPTAIVQGCQTRLATGCSRQERGLQRTLQYTLQHALLLTLRHPLQFYRDADEALRQAVLDKNVALVRELASIDAQQRLNQQSDEGTSCHM